MQNEIDPAVGRWYQHLDNGTLFRVTAVDEDEDLVEFQDFDGDIGEVTLDEWHDWDIEVTAAPEDWTGPVDDIESGDLGYSETRSEGERRGLAEERRRQNLQDPGLPGERAAAGPEEQETPAAADRPRSRRTAPGELRRERGVTAPEEARSARGASRDTPAGELRRAPGPSGGEPAEELGRARGPSGEPSAQEQSRTRAPSGEPPVGERRPARSTGRAQAGQRADGLDRDRINEVKARLTDRAEELRLDIQRELRKYDDESYTRLAERVADPGDQAWSDLVSDLNLAEVTRDLGEMRRIERALQRLAEGQYGICIGCGDRIDPERLEVNPAAVRCLECQRDFESRSRQTRLSL